MTVREGDNAPELGKGDQNGKIHSLSDYQGKWVLLYFYPKDDTPGCTDEACSLRDHFAELKKKGVDVIGVSVDSAESHQKFIQKHSLPFPLLADTDKTVVNRYGVWGKKQFMGKEYTGTSRVSFLIDPDGKIARVYPKVKPKEHAAQVLADLAGLS